jgi:hypothetical protein
MYKENKRICKSIYETAGSVFIGERVPVLPGFYDMNGPLPEENRVNSHV